MKTNPFGGGVTAVFGLFDAVLVASWDWLWAVWFFEFAIFFSTPKG